MSSTKFWFEDFLEIVDFLREYIESNRPLGFFIEFKLRKFNNVDLIRDSSMLFDIMEKEEKRFNDVIKINKENLKLNFFVKVRKNFFVLKTYVIFTLFKKFENKSFLKEFFEFLDWLNKNFQFFVIKDNKNKLYIKIDKERKIFLVSLTK